MAIRLIQYVALTGLLLTALSAHSQDWAPINKDKTYYYQADTANHITHQLQVDSTYSRNGNQVQVLNTGLQRCDTCSADNLPVVGELRDIDTIYYHIDHPFFWQRKVVDSQNRYYFYGNRDFILAPDAPKDSTWPFRPGGNVTASIDSVYQTSIFGRSDSVKRIRLSSGQTLRLTKNHGILAFPKVQDGVRYRLTGIGCAKQLGNTLSFKAIYDFQVGDVFQYEYNPFPRPRELYRGSITKKEILEKDAGPDTLAYKVESKGLRKILGGREYFGVDTSYTEIKPNGFNNCYPGEVFTKADSLGTSRTAPPLYPNPDTVKIVTSCQLTVGSNGRLTKTIGHRGYGSGPLNYYRQVKGSIYLAQSDVRGSYSKTFKEGLGLTSHGWFIFEIGSSKQLTGYVKGNETVGKVLSDKRMRERAYSSVSIPSEDAVKAYPNPVQQTLYLENLSPAQTAELRLYNQMGQLVSQRRRKGGKAHLSLEGLEPGLYILRIKDGQNLIQRKVLKR